MQVAMLGKIKTNLSGELALEEKTASEKDLESGSSEVLIPRDKSVC